MRLSIVVAMVLAAAPARAEMWGSSMGELMKDATRIELVQVDEVMDATISGTLVEPMRSARTKGARVSFALPSLPSPAVGDKVLVVCDRECPRAIGLLRDGWIRLVAQQPMDGAFVYPNIVAATSIPVLMTGKPAPNICVRGTIGLLDDKRRPKFEIQVTATDGRGEAKVGKRAVKSRIANPFGRDDSIAVELGDIIVSTASVKPVNGCLEAVFAVERPVVRTAAGLERALGARLAKRVTVARGSVVIPKGTSVRAGTVPFNLLVDEHGQLIFDGPVGKGALDQVGISNGKLELGFAEDDKKSAPTLTLVLPDPLPHHTGYVAHLVELLAGKRKLVGTATLRDGSKTIPLGAVTLVYVAE